MSITSSQTTVQLKSMTLDELKDHLTSYFDSQNMSTSLESLTDDELIMIISKNALNKTYVKLQRLRHRPLDLIILTDYKQSSGTKPVVRINKSKNNTNNSFRWLWVPLVFAGVIVTILNNLGNAIANFLGSNDGLSTFQIITITLVLSIIVGVISVYGVPLLVRQRDKSRQEFDKEVLDLLSTKIKQLDESQIDTDIKRCWSCFEEIQVDQIICPKCGNEQK